MNRPRTYFFSCSIRQHSFERQTRFQMRPFMASVILYFFTGGCVSLVSLVSLLSPSALLSTSIPAPSSPGGNGAALEAGESSSDAVVSTLLFSCFFSSGVSQHFSSATQKDECMLTPCHNAPLPFLLCTRETLIRSRLEFYQ